MTDTKQKPAEDETRDDHDNQLPLEKVPAATSELDSADHLSARIKEVRAEWKLLKHLPSSDEPLDSYRGQLMRSEEWVCGNCAGLMSPSGEIFDSKGHSTRTCTRNVGIDGYIDACPWCNVRGHNPTNCQRPISLKNAFSNLVSFRNGKAPFKCHWELRNLCTEKWDGRTSRPQTPAYTLKRLSERGVQPLDVVDLDPAWEQSQMNLPWLSLVPWTGSVAGLNPPLDLTYGKNAKQLPGGGRYVKPKTAAITSVVPSRSPVHSNQHAVVPPQHPKHQNAIVTETQSSNNTRDRRAHNGERRVAPQYGPGSLSSDHQYNVSRTGSLTEMQRELQIHKRLLVARKGKVQAAEDLQRASENLRRATEEIERLEQELDENKNRARYAAEHHDYRARSPDPRQDPYTERDATQVRRERTGRWEDMESDRRRWRDEYQQRDRSASPVSDYAGSRRDNFLSRGRGRGGFGNTRRGGRDVQG
ncbi:hypothetical protein VTL71DRAFT_4946 [Oculimacula yallundae]|uniref:Uncharacterized protein n=1 Tax=Oculimacula yallundae TaxID=86028 RepID=A0ABR4C411_9HELO